MYSRVRMFSFLHLLINYDLLIYLSASHFAHHDTYILIEYFAFNKAHVAAREEKADETCSSITTIKEGYYAYEVCKLLRRSER